MGGATLGGALVGFTVGSLKRERWERVSPRSLAPIEMPREVSLTGLREAVGQGIDTPFETFGPGAPMKTAIRLMMLAVGVVLTIDVLYFLNGSLEMFPTAEQQDKVRVVTGTIAVLLLAAEAGLWTEYAAACNSFTERPGP